MCCNNMSQGMSDGMCCGEKKDNCHNMNKCCMPKCCHKMEKCCMPKCCNKMDNYQCNSCNDW